MIIVESKTTYFPCFKFSSPIIFSSIESFFYNHKKAHRHGTFHNHKTVPLSQTKTENISRLKMCENEITVV